METINPILTSEERKVLILGTVHPNLLHLTNEEIAERLGITVSRVKTIIHQACEKLGADNRNEAVLYAMRRREITLGELLSLEELAEILCSLDPEVLWDIADFLRHNRIQRVPYEVVHPEIELERKIPGMLTNRERDVLILAACGLTNDEISEKLFISTSAVRTFLNRSFKKLGARKKADAVQLALKKREISVADISSQEDLTFYLAPFGPEGIERLAEMLDNLQKEYFS